MRTIYALQLQIVPTMNEPSACFHDLIGKVGQWVEEKYSRAWSMAISMPRDGSSIVPTDGHMLRGTSRAADDAELFSLEWSHPADDPSTAWVTNCTVARHRNAVQFAILLRISTTKIVLRPVRFKLGRPRLVEDLLSDYTALIDEWPVPTSIDHLASPQVQSYVENTLLSGARTLPVIAVSADVWTGRYSVEPTDLFQTVKGFAHVAVLTDKWASFKLTDVVEKPLSCFGGAVRVYWPGFKLDDNPFQHRLFLPQSIRLHDEQGSPLSEHLFRTLAAVASFRYAEGTVIREAHSAIAEIDKRKVDELRQQVRTGSIEKESLETELLEALERVDQLTAERDQYKDDLLAQQAAWAEVQQAIAGDGQPIVEPQEEQECAFNSVEEAVEAAKDKFTGSLVFLDRGRLRKRKIKHAKPVAVAVAA